MFAPFAIPLNNDTVTPGFLGFGVVIALGVALFFLIRSMNKQISRIQAPKEAELKQAEWERANPVPTEEESARTAPATPEPNGKAL
jgi:Na+-transporting methylmalonyl-CoA/oxaloacetate decarboxylase gamma subunit